MVTWGSPFEETHQIRIKRQWTAPLYGRQKETQPELEATAVFLAVIDSESWRLH